MSEPHTPPSQESFVNNATAAAIQIGLVALLAWWCLDILSPFIGLVAWAAIMAIALQPFHMALTRRLGGSRKLSATLIAVVGITLLVVPTYMLTESSVQSLATLSKQLEAGALDIPPPNDSVAEWPVVGKRVHEVWSEAAVNLEDTLNQFLPQLKALGSWLVSATTSTIFGVLGFVASLLIAAVLMINAESAYRAFRAIGNRLAGDKGADLTDLSIATVRSVAKGVLGVAFIQALLAAIGLIVMDIPAAGIWAGLVLLLAIMQLPPILVLGPIAFWVFSNTSGVPATIFLVYCIFVSFSDAILKPMLLGRGVDVPMLVILLGAIGGMITSGIIGLFIGAVILALGWQLFGFWLNPDKALNQEAQESAE